LSACPLFRYGHAAVVLPVCKAAQFAAGHRVTLSSAMTNIDGAGESQAPSLEQMQREFAEAQQRRRGRAAHARGPGGTHEGPLRDPDLPAVAAACGTAIKDERHTAD
jgi:hypothetical protein